MADRHTTTSRVFVALAVATAVVVPFVLYEVSARAVDSPAPDLWWLGLLPLAPGAVGIRFARERSAVAVIVVGAAVTATFAGGMASYAGDTRASEKLEALRYDDECNTATSGMSVPFHVDRAFKDVGRLESHHLHGPGSGGLHGCTMAIAGTADEAFAAWRTHLLASDWRVDRDDAEVVVVRRKVELHLYVVDEVAYLTAVEAGVDPCRAGRPAPGPAPEPGDSEVAIASPPCS